MKLRSSCLDMQQKWCCFTYTCQDHECHQRLSWDVPLYINQIFVFLLIFLPELTNARMIYSKIITRTGNSWARLKVPVYKLMWYRERLHTSSLWFQFCQPQGLRLEVVHIMSSSLGPKPENLVPMSAYSFFFTSKFLFYFHEQWMQLSPDGVTAQFHGDIWFISLHGLASTLSSQ